MAAGEPDHALHRTFLREETDGGEVKSIFIDWVV
jgi:hypothetical protein